MIRTPLWGLNWIFSCENSKSHLSQCPRFLLILDFPSQYESNTYCATKINLFSLLSDFSLRISTCAFWNVPLLFIWLCSFLFLECPVLWSLFQNRVGSKHRRSIKPTDIRKSQTKLTFSSSRVWRPRHSSDVSSSEGKKRKRKIRRELNFGNAHENVCFCRNPPWFRHRFSG